MSRLTRTPIAGSAIVGAIAALALAGGSAVAQDDDAAAAEPTKGEIELAKLLEGRVAGEPQNCIRLFPSKNLRIIDETALVYGSGRTIYVNVPRNPEDLDDWDGIQTRPFGTRLCRSTPVTTFQRDTGFYTGNIFLSEFVPYRRVD